VKDDKSANVNMSFMLPMSCGNCQNKTGLGDSELWS